MSESLAIRPAAAAQSPGWQGRLTVARADIDALDHVNNAVYLRWTEEAVVSHWTHLATESERASFYWVAVRHEIDFRRPAFLGDAIDIETRITAIRRARAWYETRIASSGQTVADVVSCWCCMDAATRRLTVIPSHLAERFLPGLGRGNPPPMNS